MRIDRLVSGIANRAENAVIMWLELAIVILLLALLFAGGYVMVQPIRLSVPARIISENGIEVSDTALTYLRRSDRLSIDAEGGPQIIAIKDIYKTGDGRYTLRLSFPIDKAVIGESRIYFEEKRLATLLLKKS